MTGSLTGNAEETISSHKANDTAINFLNKTKKKAKIVSDMQFINGLYAALDGLIISYSVFKLYFDIVCPPSATSADVMHDWLSTPTGVAKVASQSIAVIALSLISNLFVPTNNKIAGEANTPVTSTFKTFLYWLIRITLEWADWAWPYLRDAFKGLKFTYKGLRSTIQLLNLLGAEVQSYVILPLGLALGGVALLNRVLYRAFIMEPRKAAQDINIDEWLVKAKALGADYEFCEMSLDTNSSDLSMNNNKLYLEIDEINRVLKYRVYNPAKNEGQIPLKNLSSQFFDAGGNVQKMSIADLATHYSQQILFQTTKNGHTKTTNIEAERLRIRKEIDKQNPPSRKLFLSPGAWAYAVFSGFTDGLYTYMGVLLFAPMSTPILIAMTAFSVLFVLICIVNRCHEEYEYQQELLQTQASVKLVLCSKEIEERFWNLQDRSERNAANDQPTKLIIDLLDEFKASKRALANIITLSNSRAALKGLRVGLYAYSALAALMFVVSTFATTFPISLLVFGLPAVLAFMTVCVGLSWYLNQKASKLRNKTEEKDKEKERLDILADIILAKVYHQEVSSNEEKNAIKDAMFIQPSPQYPIQELCETVRSLCSGLGKGPKAVAFCFNFLLEQNAKGHYKETPALAAVGAGLSVGYGIAYGLKTFGKKFKPTEKELPVPRGWTPDVMRYTFPRWQPPHSPVTGANNVRSGKAGFSGNNLSQETLSMVPASAAEESASPARPDQTCSYHGFFDRNSKYPSQVFPDLSTTPHAPTPTSPRASSPV
jgi:hypothetical protein